MFKTLILIGGFQVLAILLTFARLKVVSVTLGPAGVGIVGTIDQFVMVVVQVGTLSVPAVALKMLSRTHGETPADFPPQLAFFVRAVLIMSVTTAVALMGLLYLGSGRLSVTLATYRAELNVALLTVPVVAVGLLLSNALAASQRATSAAAMQAGMAASAVAAVAIGIQVGGIREIYGFAFLLGALIVGAVLFSMMRSRPSSSDIAVTRTDASIRGGPGLVRSTLIVYVAVSAYTLSLLVPRYAALESLGAETAGLFQAALSIALALGAVLGAMTGQYLAPILNRHADAPRKVHDALAFQKRQLLMLAAVSLPLVVFPDIVLTVLFSKHFTLAAQWLPALVVWQMLVLQATVQQQLLFSLDDLTPLAVVSLVGYALASVLTVLTVPHWGLHGATAAMLLGAGVLNAAYIVRLRRHGFVPSRRLALLVAYITLAVLLAPIALDKLNDGFGSILARVAACASLLGGLWYFLDSDERIAVASGARRRLRSH